MAKAIPVNADPKVLEEAPAKKADPRRPTLEPETTKVTPKNSYKMPNGTLVEDY